jgi:zinc protease
MSGEKRCESLMMTMLKRFLLCFLLLCVPAAPHAAVTEQPLTNGLKVLIIEDHKVPLASFSIWYKVGSRDEPSGKTGMSHLLEHMMFKGTPKYGSKVFSNIIQRNGGIDNAYTTKDYTMYFQNLSSDRIGLSITLEADRMANLLIDPKEFSSERDVVLEERRMRHEDDPQNLLYEEVVAASLKASQYHWPVIGWQSDIASLQRDDLYRYYRRYYAPDNAFIVIAGDVTPEQVLPLLEKEFGSIPRNDNKIERVNTQEPEQKGERRVVLKKEAELPYVIVSYHVPNFPHKDSYALEVLSTILSDGKSSRLYKSLVLDKRLAINASADYSALNRDPFLFLFDATAAPAKKVEDVEAAINGEIEKIMKDPPSEREVQKAKNQIEASFIFAQDSNYTKVQYTGMFEVIGGWRLMDQYLDGIRKVRPEDLQEVAKRYLGEEKRTVGVLVPLPKGGESGE